jgi:ABC-type Fe3+/spermidine/putrescine transport system ATPase subunit
VTRIRLADLSRAFGTVWAVRDVSLDVGEAEFFSLLGPSGCGKTTTLRMVAGLEKPTGGRIWFGDDDVTAAPPQYRNVGLVFQSYAVFPTMTVYENVAYGLRVRRLPAGEIDRRVQQMLDIVGLSALSRRIPGQLSGGQMQRVALARALAIQPRVLLLDEPLSNLDAKLRVEVRAEIRRLQRDLQITTLYVSHDQEEALSISDRIGVMNAGRLEQVGRPDEIYRRPATRFVAGFVGEGTILDGVLRPDGGAGRVSLSPGVELHVAQAAGLRPGPVWVCIRPEAVRPRRSTAPAQTVTGRVEHVEFVGPVLRADVRVPGLPRLLRMSGSSVDFAGTLALGERIEVEIDPAGVSAGAPAGDSVLEPPGPSGGAAGGPEAGEGARR